MTMREVDQAFTQSVIDLALGVPIEYENVTEDPPNNGLHVAVWLVPNVGESLGKLPGDADDVQGLYQLSVYAPSGTSTGAALGLVDTILGFYRHGRYLTHAGQELMILQSGRGQGANRGGWFVIDITVTFTANIQRV